MFIIVSIIYIIIFLSLGVFALINAYAFLDYVKGLVTKREFNLLFYSLILVAAGIVFLSVILLTWTGIFYSSFQLNINTPILLVLYGRRKLVPSMYQRSSFCKPSNSSVLISNLMLDLQ